MTSPQLTPAELAALERGRFVALLGGVFEDAPWLAEQAFDAGPFRDVAALHGAMVEAMRRAPRARQLALIRAHPSLAGRSSGVSPSGPGRSPPQAMRTRLVTWPLLSQ